MLTVLVHISFSLNLQLKTCIFYCFFIYVTFHSTVRNLDEAHQCLKLEVNLTCRLAHEEFIGQD